MVVLYYDQRLILLGDSVYASCLYRNNPNSKTDGKSGEPSPAPTAANQGADAAALEDER